MNSSTNGVSIPSSHEPLRVTAAHREVDALLELGMISADQAERLKRLLTTEAIEQHDRDGMSIREIVDMHRDLLEPDPHGVKQV